MFSPHSVLPSMRVISWGAISMTAATSAMLPVYRCQIGSGVCLRITFVFIILLWYRDGEVYCIRLVVVCLHRELSIVIIRGSGMACGLRWCRLGSFLGLINKARRLFSRGCPFMYLPLYMRRGAPDVVTKASSADVVLLKGTAHVVDTLARWISPRAR